MPWYQIEAAAFPAAFACMAIVAVNGRRGVWMVLAATGTLNVFSNAEWLAKIDSDMLPLCYGSLETATILSLAVFCGHNRLALTQSALLLIAWAMHFALFIDLRADTYLVYGWYQYGILGVGLAQIALGHDELVSVGRGIASGIGSLRGLCAAGRPDRVNSGRWSARDDAA